MGLAPYAWPLRNSQRRRALARWIQADIPVALGQDVFVNGKISRETMRQSTLALRGFREVLNSWGVADENVRVIATSAVREAENRDMYVDQTALRTGFEVSVLEGVEGDLSDLPGGLLGATAWLAVLFARQLVGGRGRRGVARR